MNPDLRQQMLDGTEMVMLRIIGMSEVTVPRQLNRNDQYAVGQIYVVPDDRGDTYKAKCLDKFQPHGPELTIFVFEKVRKMPARPL